MSTKKAKAKSAKPQLRSVSQQKASPRVASEEKAINLTFGEVLQEEIMEERQLNQKVLSRESGIPESSLSRLLNSENSLSPANAKKLAAVLKVPELFLVNLADLCVAAKQNNLGVNKPQSEMIEGFSRLYGIELGPKK